MSKAKNKHPCPECGTDEFNFDPFGVGNLLDEHMDSDITEEELGKRLSDAAEMSKKLGGQHPKGLEGEIGELIAPKLTWQDFIRILKNKKRLSYKKNNWTSPRKKPLFAGLFIPTKMDYIVKFGVFYDCSGSMTKEQIAYGISQVAALNERGCGWACPFDAEPFYDSSIKLKTALSKELEIIKYRGGGGTALMPALLSYEKEMGNVDILFIISDCYFCDEKEILNFCPPKNTQIIWLSVNSNHNFNPKYGKMFRLN